MHISNKVLLSVASFILGIIISSFFNVNIFIIYIFFLLAVIAAIFLNKKIIIFIFILFFLLAVYRFNLSKPDFTSVYNLKDSKVLVTGFVDGLPEHKINKQNIILSNIEIKPLDKLVASKNYKDKILVITELYPEYKINNYLEIKCDLKTPEKFENFDYGAYLANKKIYKICYYPEIEILSHKSRKATFGGHGIWDFFINLKLKQINIIQNNLSPPHSALLSAIILGEKSEIDNHTRELFSQAGVSHIIAISGMHIGIISLLIFWSLIYIGVGRQKSFKFIILFLIFYLLLIGFMASAVRAVIMGLILMYGYKEGRLSSSARALIFAAGFLLLLNPRLLRWDVGFQLSFLATLGIIYFYTVFDKWLKKIPEKIRAILAVTLSAQILTLPLVFYYFNIVSFISLITNILILPILPVLMVLGLLFISLGFIWSKIAVVLGILIWGILEVIIKISEILVSSGFYFKI